jgi:hypothetical protein
MHRGLHTCGSESTANFPAARFRALVLETIFRIAGAWPNGVRSHAGAIASGHCP